MFNVSFLFQEKPPTPLFEILQADADTVKVAPESSDKDHEVVGDKEDVMKENTN